MTKGKSQKLVNWKTFTNKRCQVYFSNENKTEDPSLLQPDYRIVGCFLTKPEGRLSQSLSRWDDIFICQRWRLTSLHLWHAIKSAIYLVNFLFEIFLRKWCMIKIEIELNIKRLSLWFFFHFVAFWQKILIKKEK